MTCPPAEGGDGDSETLDKVNDMCGRSFGFTWTTADGNKVISSVTDPLGNVWTYEYYGQSEEGGLPGDLKKVKGPKTEESPNGKEIIYTYWKEDPVPYKGWEIKHNLRSVTDPKGQEFLICYYDDYDRVIQQHYGRGVIMNMYSVTDNGDGTTTFKTTQVDRNGNCRDFEHTALQEGAPGYEDAQQPVVSSNTPMGNPYFVKQVDTTVYTEDLGPITTEHHYTDEISQIRPKLMRTVKPLGNQIVFDRDSLGNITKITRKSHIVGEDDIVEEMLYDTFFSVVIATTDPLGNVTDHYYDMCSDAGHCVASPGYYLLHEPCGDGTWCALGIPVNWFDDNNGDGYPDHGGTLCKTVYPETKAPDPSNPKAFPSVYVIQNVDEYYRYDSTFQQTGHFGPEKLLNGSPHRLCRAWLYYSKYYGDPNPDNADLYARGKVKSEWTDYGTGNALMLREDRIYEWDSENELLIAMTKGPRDFVDNTPRDPSIFYSVVKRNVYGMTVETIDAKGYQTKHFYDANNNLKSIWTEHDVPAYLSGGEDPVIGGWLLSAFNHDILNYTTNSIRQVTGTSGLPRELTPAEFETYASSDDFIKTSTDYDLKQNPLRSRQPLGNYNEIVLNERDMVKQSIACPYDPDLSETTTYVCDVNGNTLQIYDDDGEFKSTPASTSEFDGFDRQVRTIDELGNYSETDYNSAGQVTETRMFDSSGTLLSRNINTYDELGRLVKAQTVFFKVTGTQSYATLDRLTGLQIGVDPFFPSDDSLVTTIIIFDEASKTKVVVYDRDKPGISECRTSYTYDSAGRRKTVEDSLGNSSEAFYDNNGNMIMAKETEICPLHGTQIYYSHSFYNELNQLAVSVSNMGNTRRYTYDSHGQLRITTDANANLDGVIGTIDTYGEHSFPDPGLTINAEGNRAEHGFDGLGRSIWTSQKKTGTEWITTHSVWDANSRLMEQRDGKGNRTAYFYDTRGRRVKTIHYYNNDPETNPNTYTVVYKPNGTVFKTIDPNGTEVTHLYDAAERLIHRDITNGYGITSRGPDPEYQTTFEHFEFDGFGRMTNAQDNDTSVEITYDSMSNVLAESQTIGNKRSSWQQVWLPGEAVSKSVSSIYDGSGNRLKLEYPDGSHVEVVTGCVRKIWVTALTCRIVTTARGARYLSIISSPARAWIISVTHTTGRETSTTSAGAGTAPPNLKSTTTTRHTALRTSSTASPTHTPCPSRITPIPCLPAGKAGQTRAK
jgi:YD repeat-containing protein